MVGVTRLAAGAAPPPWCLARSTALEGGMGSEVQDCVVGGLQAALGA